MDVFAAYSAAKASTCGLLALQGPHHVAENTMQTLGLEAMRLAKACGESSSVNIFVCFAFVFVSVVVVVG